MAKVISSGSGYVSERIGDHWNRTVEAERVLYAGDGKDIVIFMTKSESG